MNKTTMLLLLLICAVFLLSACSNVPMTNDLFEDSSNNNADSVSVSGQEPLQNGSEDINSKNVPPSLPEV
mgnify:CR=1 FL=1